MNNIANINKYKILTAALGISLLFHIFWLSAVKIVWAPSIRKPVKFSKVSFLGPFIERGAIDLRVQPKERTFLEKRYSVLLSSAYGDNIKVKNITGRKYEPGPVSSGFTDKGLAALVDEALCGTKEEPGDIE